MEENQVKKIEWRDEYSVGVDEIDNQHKNLIEIVNELINYTITSLSEEIDSQEVERSIDKLIDFKNIHFQTEEKYFEEFNYEYKEEHIHKHRLFNENFERIKKECEGNTAEMVSVFVNFLESWLIDHFMTEDQKYKECFKRHGLR